MLSEPAYPIFNEAEEGLGFLYEMRCPDCGEGEIRFAKVLVSQNGVVTSIDRRGDTVQEDDTSELPGACITLVCDCAGGHGFLVGLLHGPGGIRVYAAKAPPEHLTEPLWINEEYDT